MKPILFNSDMVRAILDGRKTETRRPIKSKHFQQWVDAGFTDAVIKDRANYLIELCQYQPGDILYVRETWQQHNGKYYYRADGECSAWDEILGAEEGETFGIGCKWLPSIHMPKEAARIFRRVTEIKVERVQGITEAGITAEGIYCDPPYKPKHCETMGKRIHFSRLWDSVYKARGCGWELNPWVWVIKFEKVQP